MEDRKKAEILGQIKQSGNRIPDADTFGRRIRKPCIWLCIG